MQFLKDQVKSCVIFKEFNQLQNVPVPLTLVQRLHLTEYSASTVSCLLLDDFDCILFATLQAHGTLDFGIGSFSQQFRGQLVHVFKLPWQRVGGPGLTLLLSPLVTIHDGKGLTAAHLRKVLQLSSDTCEREISEESQGWCLPAAGSYHWPLSSQCPSVCRLLLLHLLQHGNLCLATDASLGIPERVHLS